MVQWASAMTSVKEMHHLYPVLCYFRFTTALARLRQAGMDVTDDVEAGLAEYVHLRDSWDAPLVRLADLLGYTPQQIDVSTERTVHARTTP